MTAPARPTTAELAAARGKTIPDVVARGLRVLFCGINPGLYSGATGFHFARPGNRFWPALHLSGLTPRLLRPWQQEELLGLGLGITNLVERSTARAGELTRAELVAGARALERKVRRLRPGRVAVLGVGAYRAGWGDRAATVGPVDRTIGGSPAWVLPNPSGINAHYRLDDLAAAFARLGTTRTTAPS